MKRKMKCLQEVVQEADDQTNLPCTKEEDPSPSAAVSEAVYCADDYPELGVDYTAKLMKFEDALQEPGEKYTYEYLFDCRKRLQLSLERCHKRLEKVMQDSLSSIVKKLREFNHFIEL